MSNLLFPHLHGLSWSLKKTPTYKTLVQPAAAPGYETRLSMGSDAIYKFELNYAILRKGYLAHDELSVLEAFFMARQGQFDSFLLDAGAITSDPVESSVTGQALAVDVNNGAPLVRTKPGTSTTELIYELSIDGSGNPILPVIKNAGTTLTLNTDYVVYSPAQTGTGILDNNGIAYSGWVVQFLSSVSGPITANFGWLYRVRFAQDEQELDMWHALLWNAQQVQLVGTRV